MSTPSSLSEPIDLGEEVSDESTNESTEEVDQSRDGIVSTLRNSEPTSPSHAASTLLKRRVGNNFRGRSRGR